MSSTVHVKNISGQTSEKEVKEFFSFCGKIASLSLTPTSDSADASKSATVTFEKETAAKTALLLDNTQLGPSQVQVTAGQSLDQAAGGKTAGSDESDELHQEDKPRARIVAEYLAHGYVISDKAIERALALDQQHGISGRFNKALTNFDAKYNASGKAQAVDQKYGVTKTAQSGWSGLNSYFEKAMGTPTGQRVRSFYEQGNRQVLDVHNEARHLANLKGGKSGTSQVPGTERTKCNCGSDTGKCPCAPGKCACGSCAKNPDESTSVTAESAQMEKVAGTERTKCNCGSNTEKCPCAPGQCACGSCAKNPDEKTTSATPETANMEKVPGTEKTKCNCGADSGKCPCAPGQCACSSCPKNAST